MLAYKLLRVRADGTLGPLFIDARQRIPIGVWIQAKSGLHVKGYTYRPGWHATVKPEAPHLSLKGRAWFRVEIKSGITKWRRPRTQGGMWYTAMKMKVLGPVEGEVEL
jgi:hypothetical protein